MGIDVIPAPKITIVISGSSLNTFQGCPTKDLYENVMLLRPLTSPSYMDKGTLMHKVLEVYYKFIKEGLPNPVDAAIIAGRKLTVDLDLPIPDSEDVISHFQKYVLYWQGDGWTPLHVEESFSVVLYEDDALRILYEGTIDLVVKNVQGITIVVDHKTGSRNKVPFAVSNQFMGYAKSLDVTMMTVNKILFYKTENAPEKIFKRILLSYSVAQLEEWRNNAVSWAMYRYNLFKQMEAAKKEGREFLLPMNLTTCDKYSGCVYQKICGSIPGEAREYTINNEYKVGVESHDEERFKDDE